MTQLEFNPFMRRPFTVDAIKVTKENIDEIAVYVGDVEETDEGTPFIVVDPSLVPNVARVHVGYFVTKMGDYVRCYSPKVFHQQFVPMDADMEKFMEVASQR